MLECITKCRLNRQQITREMLADKNNHDTTIVNLRAIKKGVGYRLEYSPVGNSIQEPIVIICGITPGHDTWKMFLNFVRNGVPFEKAARESIYSNMRENLFQCLNKIGLFSYLALNNDYWNQAFKKENGYKDHWLKLFVQETTNTKSDLQLTQACNCAILRGSNSEQPSSSVLNEISEIEPQCLFNRFNISQSLKLIIFLGTTLELEKYWRESCYYNPNVRTLSIPHPSRSNRVFNNGDLFKPLNIKDSPQLRNAKNLLEQARQIITDLKNEKG